MTTLLLRSKLALKSQAFTISQRWLKVWKSQQTLIMLVDALDSESATKILNASASQATQVKNVPILFKTKIR